MQTNESETTWLGSRIHDREFKEEFAHEWFIEAFLRAIEDERKRQGISKTELARRMEWKTSSLSRAMRRDSNLTTKTLVSMGAALNWLVTPKLERPVPNAGTAPVEECRVFQLKIVRPEVRTNFNPLDDAEQERPAAAAGGA